MGSGTLQRDHGATRTIVYAGLIGAAYAVLTLTLAPISFGPIQLRVAGLLVPLCLLHRRYGVGLAVGLALANILSPFGWYDWLLMPIVAVGNYWLAYRLKCWPWLALLLLSIISAVAVAWFPLHMGGGIPFWPTVLMIFVSQVIVIYAGWYVIWKKYGAMLEKDWRHV